MSSDRVRTLSPYVVTRVRVCEVRALSPSFVRITFAGDGLDDFGTQGRTFDQRIKLVFPPESGSAPDLDGAGEDWYRTWLAVPAHARGSIRTYSIRSVDRDAAGTRFAVDFVLHLEPGLTGPASSWASTARVGDELVVVGPRRGRFDGGGIEWAPGDATSVLLAGDETAAPAIARILEDADPSLRGCAFIEIPVEADVLPLCAPAGIEVYWLPREGAPHGSVLIPAVLDHLGDESAVEMEDVGSDSPVWETAQYSGLGESLGSSENHADRYFWIAGESGVVTTLRRHLVRDLGVDRAQVAFMGYWRRGVAMRG